VPIEFDRLFAAAFKTQVRLDYFMVGHDFNFGWGGSARKASASESCRHRGEVTRWRDHLWVKSFLGQTPKNSGKNILLSSAAFGQQWCSNTHESHP
jgi:hypothetical protein